MKNATLLFFVVTLLTFNNKICKAQTLVNLVMADTTGQPTLNFPFQAACQSGDDFITAGNTLSTTGGSDMLITKYNSSTNTILWQINYPVSSDTGGDYVIDVFALGKYIYVAGVVTGAYNNDGVIKITSDSGHIVWAQGFGPGTGYIIATSVLADSMGNVYMAGTTQTTDGSEMTLAKYDSSGTLLWSAVYDTTGLYTGATAMALPEPGKTDIAVTGFSGTGFGAWSFVTAYFDINTGTFDEALFNSNGDGSFSSPAGIGKDFTDQTYIAGTATQSGTNTDIKTIGYDIYFDENWVAIWGNADSLADSASKMKMDPAANILITGYTTAPNNAKQLLVLKYSNTDTLLWSRTIAAPNPAFDCVGNDITSDAALNVYVTGKVWNGSNWDFTTIAFDSNGNTLWQKTYDGGATNDVANDIVVTDTGTVFVSGISSHDSAATYLTLQYQPKTFGITIVTDTGGNPLYVGNNLIVRFDPSVLDSTAINDNGKLYSSIAVSILKPAFKTLLQDSLSAWFSDFNTSTWSLIKLAPNYHTWNNYLISKIGDTVLIPPFWSSFLLVFDTVASLDRQTTVTAPQLAAKLKTLYPSVIYAHLNYLLQPASCSNGGNCDSVTPVDNFYCSEQFALHDDSSGDFTNGQMNVEAAWALETGRPFVKAGILDGDIWYQQEDFIVDSANGISKVIGGKDYVKNLLLYQVQDSSQNLFNFHGTMIAGIIGALRNNQKGIAGVAGGNFCGGNELLNPGVSLYSFGVSQNLNLVVTISMSNVVMAMNDIISNDSTIGYSNMDIVNCSNMLVSSDPDFAEYREKYYFAFRLGKIIVASRGENNGSHFTGNVPVYPACFNDDWVLSVGGSNASGDNGGGYWGSNMDIIAPYDSNMIYSTTTPNAFGFYNAYSRGAGTSYSAPFVAGLAGLELSYINNSNGQPDSKNLAPEDVEEIDQRSAYFDSITYTDPPYDQMVGWGRLDMGNAMHMLDKSHHRLLHFNSDSLTPSSTVVQLDTNISLTLLEDIPNPAVSFLRAGNYKADVFKLTEVTNHHISLATGESIRGFWARSSSSDSYPLFSTVDSINQLEPYEKDTIDEINGPVTTTHATIWGYYYKIMDSATNAFKAWIPQSPYGSDSVYPRMSYTVYVSSDTAIPTAIKLIKDSFSISLFPNPAENIFHFNLQSSQTDIYSVNLYNSLGQPIKTLFNGVTDYISADYSVNAYEAGMYYIRVSSLKQVQTIKLIITK